MLDCAIIGGGPAGLTAGLYLARFNRNFLLIDGGCSRARWIPKSHNLPLFTQGITGPEILRKQREHAALYGAKISDGTVTGLSKDVSGFTVQFRERGGKPSQMRARFVLLATGVADIPPPVPNVDDAVKRGLIRYCPICDGYEAKGKKVGVIGVGDKGVGEAVFIASAYSSSVTLLSFHEPLLLSGVERGLLEKHKIGLIREPIVALACEAGKISAKGTAAEYEFDVVYSALGVRYRSDLATALGADCDDRGALDTGEHSETTVPGLYAAGDVTQGLNQIVTGMGQAARAATHIHNSL